MLAALRAAMKNDGVEKQEVIRTVLIKEQKGPDLKSLKPMAKHQLASQECE